MTLLTKELLRVIPPLYSQEKEADPLCRARFYLPDGAFAWFAIEGSTREKAGCGWGVGCQHRPCQSMTRPEMTCCSLAT